VSDAENENPFQLTPGERQSVRFRAGETLPAVDRECIKRALQGIKLNFGAADGSDWWAMSVAMEDYNFGAMRETYQQFNPELSKLLRDVRTDYRVLIRKQVRAIKSALKTGDDIAKVLQSAVALGAILAEARLYDRLARDTSAGKGVRRGNRKGNIALHGIIPIAEKYAAYRASFEKHHAAGMSKEDAKKAASRENGNVSTRIIQRAVTGK
jgi:hypothetical protein